jgi:hypothetical protein
MDGYILMPLPVKKIIWEAKDAEIWRKEFDICLKEREIYGVSSRGKLTKLQQTFSGLTTTEASWEKWLAGMDSFGSIVTTAASLV